MHVLIRLPALAAASLRTALLSVGPHQTQHIVCGLDIEAVRIGVDVLVLDPALTDETNIYAIAAALHRRQIPVVLYGSLTPRLIVALLVLSRVSYVDVVLRNPTSGMDRLGEAFAALPMAGLDLQLAERLSPLISVLPERLQFAITLMFTAPIAPQSAQQLAAAAGLTRRSLDRWIFRARITSTRRLVAAARLVRAFPCLMDRDLSMKRTATFLGYSEHRRLDKQCRELTGMGVLEIRAEMDAKAFVDCIVRRLRDA